MLRNPRPLPQRFNRPIRPETRTLVQRRLKRRREYLWQRWHRARLRWQRKVSLFREVVRRFLVVAGIGIVVLVIGFLIFSPVLHIREVKVMRSDTRIDADLVQRALAPVFGNHLFFLSAQDVEKLLRDAVPDLDTVQVAKEYPSSLQLKMTLDPIIARLTIDDPDHKVSGSGAGIQQAKPPSDFLTSEGMYVAYFDAQVRTSTGLLALRVVDWGVRPVPWKPLIDPLLLQSLREAETALTEQFGHTLRSRTVYLRAQEFHLQTSGLSLWFDLRSPLMEQLDRYRLYLRMAGPSAAREYVDLRLADKIVYK